MADESISRTEVARTPVPQALLDAGDEAWGSLRDIITRCLDELLVGEVLEVVSHVVDLRIDLPAWCARVGHELLGTREDEEKTSFWIGKQMATRQEEGCCTDTTPKPD